MIFQTVAGALGEGKSVGRGVGRVGALAVALGIGVAVAALPVRAFADSVGTAGAAGSAGVIGFAKELIDRYTGSRARSVSDGRGVGGARGRCEGEQFGALGFLMSVVGTRLRAGGRVRFGSKSPGASRLSGGARWVGPTGGVSVAAVGEAGVADGAPEGRCRVLWCRVLWCRVPGVGSFSWDGAGSGVGIGSRVVVWVGIEVGLLVDLAAVMGGVHCRGWAVAGFVCRELGGVAGGPVVTAGGLTEARPTPDGGGVWLFGNGTAQHPDGGIWWGMGIPGRLRRASVGWRARGQWWSDQ